MENEIEILKAQVAALKELVAIKDQTIAELKLKPNHSTVTHVYEYRYPQYAYQYQQGVQYPYQVYCGGAQGQGSNQNTFQGSLQGQVGGGFSGQAGQAGGGTANTCEAMSSNLMIVPTGQVGSR